MRNIIIAFVIGLLIGGGIVAYKLQPDNTHPGSISPELAGKPQTLEILPVKTYPALVNKKLGIPATNKVLTSTKLVATKRPQTVTAVIDSEGTTRLYVRTDPLPWFSRARKQQLSLTYGVMDRVGVKRLEYRYDMWHVKQLDLGLTASANILSSSPSHSLLGVSVLYSW